MAFTSVVTHATGDVLPASDWNTYLRDNMAYLHGDAGTVVFTSGISTGPTSIAAGGGGVAGALLNTDSGLYSFHSTTAASIIAASITTDSQFRFKLDHTGKMVWGPGGATAPDTTFGRLAAAVLGDPATGLSTGPTSTAAGGGAVVGSLLSADSGLYTVGSIAANSIIAASITTDSQYRFKLDHGGVMVWGPGGSTAPDSTLARSIAGVLKVSNAFRQVKATITYSASMTPDASAGEYQSITVTNTTAMTVNAPTNPPGASETQFLHIEFFNNSGGTMGAITWNAAFKGIPGVANPATGSKITFNYRWNGTAWILTNTTPSTYT